MEILPFRLPNESLIASLLTRFPCREVQIRSLATLLSPTVPSPRNIVLYGLEATGKSAVIHALLNGLSSHHASLSDAEVRVLGDDTKLRYAILKSSEYITGRHLLEATVAAVAESLDWPGDIGRCENLAQLVIELSKLLETSNAGQCADGNFVVSERFVLVFDGIDRQRDAPATMLPALARLGDIIPNLTVIFIVTAPRPHFLHTSHVPYVHFPAYTKQEAIRILALDPPALSPAKVDGSKLANSNQPTSKDIYPRFVSAVWDSLSKHSGHDIISLRSTALSLWPTFTSSLSTNTHPPPNFSKLLISNRTLFQNEDTLIPSITPRVAKPVVSLAAQSLQKSSSGLATQLPLVSRVLLVAAYLSSHVPSRFDIQVFSSHASHRRKKKGGGTALARPGRATHRKIPRRLLGPQSFVLERMFAVFWAVVSESNVRGKIKSGGLGSSADIQMAVATLASLRLVIRCSGGGDALDASGKWKVNVGWEVVRGVGRSVGIEVEEFLVD